MQKKTKYLLSTFMTASFLWCQQASAEIFNFEYANAYFPATPKKDVEELTSGNAFYYHSYSEKHGDGEILYTMTVSVNNPRMQPTIESAHRSIKHDLAFFPEAEYEFLQGPTIVIPARGMLIYDYKLEGDRGEKYGGSKLEICRKIDTWDLSGSWCISAFQLDQDWHSKVEQTFHDYADNFSLRE